MKLQAYSILILTGLLLVGTPPATWAQKLESEDWSIDGAPFQPQALNCDVGSLSLAPGTHTLMGNLVVTVELPPDAGGVTCVVGCSNTSIAWQGYRNRFGSALDWSQGAVPGCSIDWLASNAAPRFCRDAHEALLDSPIPGACDRIWFQPCFAGGESPTPTSQQRANFAAVVEWLRTTPGFAGAPIYASSLPEFRTGCTRGELSSYVSDVLIQESIDAGDIYSWGPYFPPMELGDARQDNCHQSSSRRSLDGQILCDFFGGCG